MSSQKYQQLEQIYQSLQTFTQKAKNSISIKHNYMWSQLCILKNTHKKLTDNFQQISQKIIFNDEIQKEDKRIKFIASMIEKSKKKQKKIRENTQIMGDKLSLFKEQVKNLKLQLHSLLTKNKNLKEKLFILQSLQDTKDSTIQSKKNARNHLREANLRIDKRIRQKKSHSVGSVNKNYLQNNRIDSIIDQFNAIWIDYSSNNYYQSSSQKKPEDEQKKVNFFTQKFPINEYKSAEYYDDETKNTFIQRYINKTTETADNYLIQRFSQAAKARKYFHIIPSQAVIELVLFHKKMPQILKLIQCEKKQFCSAKQKTIKNCQLNYKINNTLIPKKLKL